MKNLSFKKKALPKKYYTSDAMKKINKKGYPAIIYIHPWEIDPKQPRVKELKWYHYYNLSKIERKFKKLLKDFKFSSIQEWIFHA